MNSCSRFVYPSLLALVLETTRQEYLGDLPLARVLANIHMLLYLGAWCLPAGLRVIG